MDVATVVVMDTATQTLVIILSLFLALFLLLSIIICVQVIKLLHTLRTIADKAERVVDSAESVGTIFRNASGPLALMRVVANMVESATKHKQSKDRG